MFREILLPIFRSTRLCVTVCGIMHPRCCRPVAGNIVGGALYHIIPLSWVVHYTTLYHYRGWCIIPHYTTKVWFSNSGPSDRLIHFFCAAWFEQFSGTASGLIAKISWLCVVSATCFCRNLCLPKRPNDSLKTSSVPTGPFGTCTKFLWK